MNRCESCGHDDPVQVVRRLYVIPATWDAEEQIERGDTEAWCDVCRAHYPHEEP